MGTLPLDRGGVGDPHILVCRIETRALEARTVCGTRRWSESSSVRLPRLTSTPPQLELAASNFRCSDNFKIGDYF
jgi:hypothetical protein